MRKTGLVMSGLALSPLISKSYFSIYGQTAPSNKVRVALIGCHSMGYRDLNAFPDYPGMEHVVLCNVDDEWLNRRAVNVEERTEKKVPRSYKDWRRIIDSKDIDVVIIGTLDHWHYLSTIWACQAGRDVYVERPLSNTIEECDLVEKAAYRHNRIVQAGRWQHSDPYWDEAAGLLEARNIGRVCTIKVWAYQSGKPTFPAKPDCDAPASMDYDMWLDSAPKRPFNPYHFHYSSRFFWDYAGGLISGWGVHLLGYTLEGINVDLPGRMFSGGGKLAYPSDAMETPGTLMATCVYDDSNIIRDHARGINHGLYNRKEGLAFYGKDGTMVFDRAGWGTIPAASNNAARMKAIPFRKGKGKGLYNHAGNMLSCIKSCELPSTDVAIDARIVKMVHLANISCRVQQEIRWDNKNNLSVGDNEAAASSKAYYRAPWELPKL